MQTSRACGAEVFSCTRKRVSPTPASTRAPKAWRLASGTPVRGTSGALAVDLPRETDPAITTGGMQPTRAPRLDQGPGLAAVNGDTGPADPAGARRHKKRHGCPDLFGAAK